MTKALRFLAALLVALPVFAQAQRTYSQAELDQMLAPIALYPDALLSQVLLAATYPDEVDKAARWSAVNPGLQGDTAVQAARNDGWDWDPSVQSLVAFPPILARMRENPGWTRSLGDAFLMQQQVMDTVQQLRRRAQAAGNLRSGEQFSVQQQGEAIMVQPASPYYVTVPYYDPLVVYGPWWWPTYRPMVWAPWPRAYAVPISFGFFFGNFDWHRHQVRVVHPTAYYYRPAVIVNQAIVATPHRWQHEPRLRTTIAGRQDVQVRQQVQIQSQIQTQQARVRAIAVPAAQAQPLVQAQPAVQARPRVQQQERRVEQRTEQRTERREERHIERPLAQPQARMPAAVAVQQPRAERQDQRRERNDERTRRASERS